MERIELRLYKSGTFTSSFVEAKSTSIAPFLLPYPADSIQVFIKDTHRQTHYSRIINKPSQSEKFLQFDNPRNILNINNYEVTREELSCNGSHTKYYYSF